MGITAQVPVRRHQLADLTSSCRYLLVSVCAALLLAACLGDDAERAALLPSNLVLVGPAQAEVGVAIQLGSSSGSAAGIRYEWNFGDGRTSSEASPAHVYAQPGHYRLKLQISNGTGQTRSAEAELLVGRFAALRTASRCTGPDKTGWCQQWPLDTAREITPLFYRGGMQAYGAGSDGTLYYTDSPIGAWQEARTDTAARSIEQIAFADADTGWAIGITALPEVLPGTGVLGRGVLLLKTIDAGKSWFRQDLTKLSSGEKLRVPGSSLRVLDGSNLVLSDDTSRVRWASSDGGKSWTTTPWTDALIYPRSGTSVWSLVRDTDNQTWVLRRSRDLGTTFQPSLRLAGSDNVAAVNFADDLHGWVMVSIAAAASDPLPLPHEKFWATEDGGSTWTFLDGDGLVRSPIHFQPPTVAFLDADRGVASNTACGNLTRYEYKRTIDGGRTWTPIGPPAGAALQDLTVVSISAVWTSGRTNCTRGQPVPPRRGAYLSRDLGRSWQFLDVSAEPIESRVRAMLVAEDQSIELSYSDTTYRSADGGASWARIWPEPTTQFEAADGKYAVAFAGPSVGMAISASGRLLRSTDGGRIWQPRSLAVRDPYAPNDRRKALNQRGRIQPIDADRSWIEANDGIFRVTSGGASWDPLLVTGDSTSTRDLFFAEAGNGWVIKSSYFDASDLQSFQANPPRIWETRDAGLSWRESARLDFQPHGLHFADAGLGLVVGEGGVILRTTDGGASWLRSASGTTSDLHRVRFVDAHAVWAIGAPGAGVRVSHDAGLSWQSVMINSPHAWNGLHFIDPLRGWIVGDFGSIASTRDGGRSWQMQDSGTSEHLFDVFGVDAETAWTVGERGVIRATATGGD